MSTNDSVTTGVLQALIAALTGFVAGLVSFRTRLALSDAAAVVARKESADRFARIEALQRATLQIVADMAHAAGTDKRFNDVVLRLLANEAEQ